VTTQGPDLPAEATQPPPTQLLRFALYARVSTEDQQDPESSLGWQRHRAEATINGHGEIVVEYFDVGESRSVPWKRRPEANRLLQSLGRDDRDFDAVVIGEPQRAFYGSQFAMTFPLFTHHGVGLWVPGGRWGHRPRQRRPRPGHGALRRNVEG
jgi:site-specific DNA recombinase